MTIQFEDVATGALRPYRPVAERAPEFFARFPIHEGWAVRKDLSWGEALFPDRIALWKEAIQKGQPPERLGLPVLPSTLVLVRASLLHPDGRVVAEAHSLGNIQGEKDLESLETAAFGRLMTAAGIPSDVPVALTEAPVSTPAPGPAPSTWEVVPVPLAEAPGAQRTMSVTPPPAPDPVVAAPVAPAPVVLDPVAPAPVVVPEAELGEPGAVPLVLQAQIAAVAQSKGREPPEAVNARHAREILKALRAL